MGAEILFNALLAATTTSSSTSTSTSTPVTTAPVAPTTHPGVTVVTTTTTAVKKVAAASSSASALLFLGVIIAAVAFYMLVIRPQGQRQREQRAKMSDYAVGDEVLTIGGIVGVVVSMDSERVTIETGSEEPAERKRITLVKRGISGKLESYAQATAPRRRTGIASRSARPEADSDQQTGDETA